MDDFDHADLDGDGEFDAIDLSIMEDNNRRNQSPRGNNGCCVLLLTIGSSVGIGWSLVRYCI